MAHNRGYAWMEYINGTVGLNGGNASYLKTDLVTCANNATTALTAPTALIFWPGHYLDLRAVYGKDSGNVKDQCTNSDPSNALFKVGATFNDYEANTYTVYGLRQERFRIRDMK